jgi:hypothetical protein
VVLGFSIPSKSFAWFLPVATVAIAVTIAHLVVGVVVVAQLSSVSPSENLVRSS